MRFEWSAFGEESTVVKIVFWIVKNSREKSPMLSLREGNVLVSDFVRDEADLRSNSVEGVLDG